jgi:hypothetical protein
MAKTSSSKLLTRARQSMARAREKERQTTYLAIEKGAGLATSVGLAVLSEKIPVSVAGIPTKLILAAGAYVGAVTMRGNVARALESTGDAASHIYAYLATLKVKQKQDKPWVAGDDETGVIEEV